MFIKITLVSEIIMSNLVRKLPPVEKKAGHLAPKAERREPGCKVGYDYTSL